MEEKRDSARSYEKKIRERERGREKVERHNIHGQSRVKLKDYKTK